MSDGLRRFGAQAVPPMPPIRLRSRQVNHVAIAGWGTLLTFVALGLIAAIPVLPTVTLHKAMTVLVGTFGVAFAILAILFALMPPTRSKDGF